MKKKNKRRLLFWVAMVLMLLAIWAYVASLDESEPLSESLPLPNAPGERGR